MAINCYVKLRNLAVAMTQSGRSMVREREREGERKRVREGVIAIVWRRGRVQQDRQRNSADNKHFFHESRPSSRQPAAAGTAYYAPPKSNGFLASEEKTPTASSHKKRWALQRGDTPKPKNLPTIVFRREIVGVCEGFAHSLYNRRYFQHAHFIPIVGVRKRGEY